MSQIFIFKRKQVELGTYTCQAKRTEASCCTVHFCIPIHLMSKGTCMCKSKRVTCRNKGRKVPKKNYRGLSRIATDCPKCLCVFLGLPEISWEMTHQHLGLPETFQNVPGKGYLRSLVPCPLSTWDHLGHLGLAQLRASYTTLSHAYPLSTWDHLGHPGSAQVRASYKAWSHVPRIPGITCDIPGCPS